MTVDKSGVYIAGRRSGVGFIRKYDHNGNQVWTKTTEAVAPNSFVGSVETGNNSVFVLVIGSGYFIGEPFCSAASSSCAVLFRYTPSGIEEWHRVLSVANSPGVDPENVNQGLAVDLQGRSYITTAQYGQNNRESVIGQLNIFDAQGNDFATSTFGNPLSGNYTIPHYLSLDESSIYVTGEIQESAQPTVAFIEKFDKSGGIIFSKEIITKAVDSSYGRSQTSGIGVSAGCSGVFVAGSVSNGQFLTEIETDKKTHGFLLKLGPSEAPCEVADPHVTVLSDPLRIPEGATAINDGLFNDGGSGLDTALTATPGSLIRTGQRSGVWQWSYPATDGPAQSRTVTLTADNGKGGVVSSPFELIVDNVPPEVSISGLPASVQAGTPAELQSAVSDPSPDDRTAGFAYRWTVTLVGTSVTSSNAASLAFTPAVAGSYQIVLEASDKDGGKGSAAATLNVTAPVNQPPLANAGADQTSRGRVGSKTLVLDGRASRDPDQRPSPLTYRWSQTGEPTVNLSDNTSSTPSFRPTTGGAYTFSLSVSDGQDSSPADSVSVTVPKLGDVDLDGDVDNADLSLIVAARNKPASSPTDLRDLNSDLKIDVLDSRKLTTLCDRPSCATQ